jgi:hypothetical protein
MANLNQPLTEARTLRQYLAMTDCWCAGRCRDSDGATVLTITIVYNCWVLAEREKDTAESGL